ncbi:MAG: DUF58 domain-containing protein [Proteobacteria bacterium]|nr:DUF58 domain-containing protein [Pseudomonadota bacterium]
MQTGTFICGAVGLDTDLSFVYQLFALLFCTLVFARLSIKFHSPDVSVRRQLPRYATAGVPFEYFISVINDGNRVERDLKVIDNPKIIPPDLAQFERMREPGEETRNAYDRWLGFHRFIWLQKLNTGISLEKADVPDVELLSHAQAVVEATPLRRGHVYFESTTVLPKRYPVPWRFEFKGGRHFQPGGINSTWSIGESDEFVSLRDYREGDPVRKIHWASSAKREKPVVKEFQDEFFVRQTLIVDTFGDKPAVFEEVISVAASLLMNMENLDGLMDLCFMSTRPEIITAGRGHAQTSQQLEALATLQLTQALPADFADFISGHARRISGCLLVLSGFIEEQKTLLAAIENAGVQTAVFIVTDKIDETTYREDFHVLQEGDIEAGLLRL